MRCGVICFSPCLQSVLLIKTQGSASWSFPHTKIGSGSGPSAHAEGAIAGVKQLTGVQLSDADLQTNRWIQVDGEAVSGVNTAEEGPVKLFIACGVEPDDHQLRAAAPVVDVQWWPWTHVVDQVTGSSAHANASHSQPAGEGAGGEQGVEVGGSQAEDSAGGTSIPTVGPQQLCTGVASGDASLGQGSTGASSGGASEPVHAPEVVHETGVAGEMKTSHHGSQEFEGLVPFMPELLQLLQRSPQLRVQGPDPHLLSLLRQLLPHLAHGSHSTSPETDVVRSGVGQECKEMAAERPSPKEYLESYCRENDLPAPCYSLIVKKSSNRNITLGSCILPHLGVQITPDEVLQYKEAPEGGTVNLARQEAEQVAALFAMLYIEGVLGVHTEWARIVPVGFPPLLRPHQLRGYDSMVQRKSAWLDSQKTVLLQRLDQKRQKLEAELAALSKTAHALESGASYEILKTSELRAVLAGALGPAGAPLLPSGRQPRPAKRARTTANASEPPISASTTSTSTMPKSKIQELKEFCDRRKWLKPDYVCKEDEAGGGFTCTLQLPGTPEGATAPGLGQASDTAQAADAVQPEAKILVTSKPAPNKRKAKEAAAQLALQQLAELGL